MKLHSSASRGALPLMRLALYAMPFVIIFLSVYQDLNPSGVRSFFYAIGSSSSAMISPLFPEQRLDPTTKAGQRVLVEPVYFTVRYPHRYDTAIVGVHIRSDRPLAYKIGLAVKGPEDWSYSYATPDSTGSVTFDLSNAKVSGDSLRFIIATSDDLSTNNLSIEKLSVVLKRDSLFATLRKRL